MIGQLEKFTIHDLWGKNRSNLGLAITSSSWWAKMEVEKLPFYEFYMKRLHVSGHSYLSKTSHVLIFNLQTVNH